MTLGNLADLQHGIVKHVTPRLTIDLQNEKSGVRSIEVFGTFHYGPPPCSQTPSGATIVRKLHLLSQSKVE